MPASGTPVVATGARTRVTVPATSANLGPGYDALGLALDLTDVVEVTATGPVEPTRVRVEGEGVGEVPLDDTHLVLRAVRDGLRAAGASYAGGLDLLCRNMIPHGRGLGSSAAAYVAGLVAARGLLEVSGHADLLHDDAVLRLADAEEGHPDNAAAAVLGGVTIAWREGTQATAVRLEPHPDLACVLAVPGSRLSTATARAVLPTVVPHEDAALTAGRAALLVEALTRRPGLLLPATLDRLHQDHRAPAMPWTAGLVTALRAEGAAAVVSGAGPSVLVLATRDAAAALARRVTALAGPDATVLTSAVSGAGARCELVPAPSR